MDTLTNIKCEEQMELPHLVFLLLSCRKQAQTLFSPMAIKRQSGNGKWLPLNHGGLWDKNVAVTCVTVCIDLIREKYRGLHLLKPVLLFSCHTSYIVCLPAVVNKLLCLLMDQNSAHLTGIVMSYLSNHTRQEFCYFYKVEQCDLTWTNPK